MCQLMLNNVDIIKARLSEAALYEQLAEECSELAQAALKKSRKLRDENYTPLSMDEIDSSLEEEYSDIFLITEFVLALLPNFSIMERKSERWANRLQGNRDE